MKFFKILRDIEGSCYHEFYKGRWQDGKYWNAQSIFLHDDELFAELEELLYYTISDYDPYSNVEVNRKDWDKVVEKAKEKGGKTYAIIIEANNWAENVFAEHDVFTILGI